jgi:hypothetical protein
MDNRTHYRLAGEAVGRAQAVFRHLKARKLGDAVHALAEANYYLGQVTGENLAAGRTGGRTDETWVIVTRAEIEVLKAMGGSAELPDLIEALENLTKEAS